MSCSLKSAVIRHHSGCSCTIAMHVSTRWIISVVANFPPTTTPLLLWNHPFKVLTSLLTPGHKMTNQWRDIKFIGLFGDRGHQGPYTVKCHYNACHYNANASLTRSILGSQTAPTCPHDHPRVAQHMGYRCEIIAVWSATAAMTPLCSHTNGIKQRYPTCWLCQYSRFMIDLRSNTMIIHLRCSEKAINRPIWLPDVRMLKTILVAIKLT